MRRKIIAVGLAFSMICSLGGGNMVHVNAAKKPALNKGKVNLFVNEKTKLRVKNVSKAKIKKQTFKSNRKKVASVNRSGMVTARKKGVAVITCSLTLKNRKKYKLHCRVNVKASQNADEDYTASPASDVGAATASPGTSIAPVSSDAPNETKSPTESVAPEESVKPEESNTPEESVKPEESSTPEESVKPAESGTPEESVKPEESGTPKESVKPEESSTPEESVKPEESETPKETATPEESLEPVDWKEVYPDRPERTAAPAGEHLSCNGVLTSDDSEMRSDLTAFELIHEMGVGINLGNTMESVGSYMSSVNGIETGWGAPVTTQQMITGMKQAGFSSIRIPVAWSNLMSKDGTYQIDRKYFDRVEEIMNYALNEDMYVIVNIHWDGGWWARFGSKNAQERAAAMEKYKSMWRQIALQYEEYSDHVIFESANEELGRRLNATDDYSGSGYFSSEAQLYELTNEINQVFVDTVRETGGNNSKRFLLLAGYDTDISKTCDGAYEIPVDTIENHLMVSVHYYSPADYCLATRKNNSWGYRGSWGTDADVKEMKQELEKLKTSFTNHGIPVIIGEYGVDPEEDDNGNFVKIKDGRDKFFQTVCEYSLENGICPVLWDTAYAQNCIYDRKSCAINRENEKQVYLDMAAKAEASDVFVPAEKSREAIWTGTLGMKNWGVTDPVSENQNSFLLSGSGAAYSIAQVYWTDFQNPVLTMHADDASGTVSCVFAKTINTSNVYWPYIEDKDALKSVSWDLSKDLTIDLAELQLTGKQTLHFTFKEQQFQANITIRISEKESDN